MAEGIQTFINPNVCVNFKLTDVGTSAYVALPAHLCSEVILTSATATLIWDGNADFLIPANAVTTIRGITNTANLSAKSSSGTIILYGRSQYYGSIVKTA